MTWTELVTQFSAQLPPQTPPLTIDRVSKRNPTGHFYYSGEWVNPAAPLGTAIAGNEMPLQAGERFRTRIFCPLTLSHVHHLTIEPKSGLFSTRRRWNTKSDLPEDTTQQLTELMAYIPADTPLLTLSLTPLEGTQHMLCISTDALQDEVGNFCIYSEWHPAAPDGTDLTGPQAAEFLLKRMARILQIACATLYEP